MPEQDSNKSNTPAPQFDVDTAQGILAGCKWLLQATADGIIDPRQAGAMNGTYHNIIDLRNDVIELTKLREELDELKQRLGVTSRTELVEAIRRLSPEAKTTG